MAHDSLDEFKQKQREMFDELVRGERQAYRTETRLNLGHDSYKPVEVAFSMLRMTEDKSIRVVGSITDIEKRRRELYRSMVAIQAMDHPTDRELLSQARFFFRAFDKLQPNAPARHAA